TVSLSSSPPGAKVEIQDYQSPGGAWRSLGATPLDKIRIPDGYFRWKVSHEGINDYVAAPFTNKEMNFPLETAQKSPEGMVPISGEWGDFIGFIGWLGPYDLPLYYMDRFEVTNAEYQKFVDGGGYEKRQYWNEKFIK